MTTIQDYAARYKKRLGILNALPASAERIEVEFEQSGSKSALVFPESATGTNAALAKISREAGYDLFLRRGEMDFRAANAAGYLLVDQERHKRIQEYKRMGCSLKAAGFEVDREAMEAGRPEYARDGSAEIVQAAIDLDLADASINGKREEIRVRYAASFFKTFGAQLMERDRDHHIPNGGEGGDNLDFCVFALDWFSRVIGGASVEHFDPRSNGGREFETDNMFVVSIAGKRMAGAYGWAEKRNMLIGNLRKVREIGGELADRKFAKTEYAIRMGDSEHERVRF